MLSQIHNKEFIFNGCHLSYFRNNPPISGAPSNLMEAQSTELMQMESQKSKVKQHGLE